MALHASYSRRDSLESLIAGDCYEETDGLTGPLPTSRLRDTSSIWSRGRETLSEVASMFGRRLRNKHRVPISANILTGKEGASVDAKQARAATAYLDGLRGVAALSVVFQHMQQWVQYDYGQDLKILEMPFGWHGFHYFACLPGIRLAFTGGSYAVSLFFIMSGYVLSNKPCKLVASKQFEKLAQHLGSAMFRRWFRLFLPIFAVDFVWLTSWYLGVHSSRPKAPEASKTYMGELQRYSLIMSDLSDFFGSKNPEVVYNPPTWTIPDEFQGSMVVYVSILALAQFSSMARLLCETVLCIYFLCLGHGPLALFLAGMIICHVDTLRRGSWTFNPLQQYPLVKKCQWILWYATFLLGLYLGGASEGTLGHDSWKRRHFVSACLLMIAIPRIAWCRSILEWRLCQFLGRISFALYLTHLPVLWIIGARIFAAFGRFRGNPELFGTWSNRVPLSGYGPVGMQINVVVPGLLFIGTCFGVAELVTRFIDEPSVKFAQWLFGQGLKPRIITQSPEQIEMAAADPSLTVNDRLGPRPVHQSIV